MNSTTFINLFISSASLLSGDPTDCLDPTNITDESCAGGLASVASVIRHSQHDGRGALYIPKLDRISKFVQMHPLRWSVNKLISHDRFGWEAYFTSPSLFSESARLSLSKLRSHVFPPVVTNLDLPPTNPWSDYLSQVYFHDASGTANIHITSEVQPMAARAVDSLVAALDYVAELNTNSGCFRNDDYDDLFDEWKRGDDDYKSRCWSAVVFFNEEDNGLYDACLRAALAHSSPPLVFYDIVGNSKEYSFPRIVNNGTVVFNHPDPKDEVANLRLEVGQYDTNKRRSITNMTYSNTVLEELPLQLMDDVYVEDRTYLRKLADEAIENDPIVGMSAFMPLTRVDKLRMCMGGECPIGNLFTDAMRWASDADFAVVASGGLRGPGWDEGPVNVGDLWAALPFMNYMCTGTMSGVSVYRLLNYTTAVATFQSTFTVMGDRLLQMSGMRMTYNTLVNATGLGRLMSVEMWDEDTQGYLPLERLKLYRFATDGFMCGFFDPYPSLFGSELKIDGEKSGVVDKSRTVQDVVGEYLTNLNKAYDTSIQGRLINDTEAFDPLNFIQTSESCLIYHYWETSLSTCKPCPGGKFVKFSDDLIPFLITSESNEFSGRNVLFNRETFNVTIARKYAPSWVVFRNEANILMEKSVVLQPGESIAISFDVDASDLSRGSSRSTVSYGVVVDGNYPGCLTDLDITFDVLVELRAEENLNQINSIRPVGLFFMALVMALSILLFLWTFKNRNNRVVRASQPQFLTIICVGIFIMASSIIPLSIDDSIASHEACSIACMAFPWLFLMGFSITWSSLLAKILRVNRVMGGADSFRRVVVKVKEASLPIVILFLLNFVLLLCWTLIDPLKWQREPITLDDPTNTYGNCTSEGKGTVVFLALLSFLDVLALVLACGQAYRARKMDDEFTESRWLAVACASWIQVLVIGVPILLLTHDDPVASYFTQMALVFLVCMSMLLLIFLPKMKLMKKMANMPQGRTSRRTSTASGGTSRMTTIASQGTHSQVKSGPSYVSPQASMARREALHLSRIYELEALLKAKEAKSPSANSAEEPESMTPRGKCNIIDDLPASKEDYSSASQEPSSLDAKVTFDNTHTHSSDAQNV